MTDFIKEYEEINRRLGEATALQEESITYTELNRFIVKIADYMLSSKKSLKKGVDDAMGGKVLELESERLVNKGIKIGIVITKYSDGCSIEKIAEEQNMKVKEVEEIIKANFQGSTLKKRKKK